MDAMNDPRIDDGKPGDVMDLWSQFWASAGDDRDSARNRLACHYFDWASQFAETIARKMQLADLENAVGDVLLRFVDKIIPSYDGRVPFENFAGVCIRRIVIDRRMDSRRL